MHAVRPVCTEHDGLLDVARPRGSGDQVDGPRHCRPLLAHERERFFHSGDDAGGAFLIAFAEFILRLMQVVYAPFYALFIVGPTANLIEIWWESKKDQTVRA